MERLAAEVADAVGELHAGERQGNDLRHEPGNRIKYAFVKRALHVPAGRFPLDRLLLPHEIRYRVSGFSDRSAGNRLFEFPVSDFGFSGTHDLPWHGAFSASYNYTDVKSDFGSTIGQNANTSSYTTNSETADVSFHPTLNLGLFANESYIGNLSGYFYQALITGSGAPPVELGTGSHSTTFGGGANYQFTKDLSGVAQATYYDQAYLETAIGARM